MSSEARMIRVTPGVMERMWMRTADGRRITIDWGEPDEQGFYSPVFTATDDGSVIVTEEGLAQQLSNNDFCGLNDRQLHQIAAAIIADVRRRAAAE